MDAHKRLLKTRKVQELTLASRVLSKFPNASITQLKHVNYKSIILFYDIDIISSNLSFSKPIERLQTWILLVICVSVHKIKEYAGDKQIAWLKLYDFAGYVIKHGGQTTESQVANALEAKEGWAVGISS